MLGVATQDIRQFPKKSIYMSLFTAKRVADGYAKYRPRYHPLIMKKIRINFIMTQSNVIAPIDAGKEDVASVKDWMYNTLMIEFSKKIGYKVIH